MAHPEPQTSYILHEEPVDNTLVFLHLQKCSGTTLHVIIANQYREMYGEDALEFVPLHWWPYDRQLKNILVYKGHFNFGQEERMLLPVTELPRTYVTILRNPVDRVLSAYHYHFIRHKTFNQWSGGKEIPILEFLQGNFLINSNMVTYMLGGHQKNIHRAIENLHKFDVVGLTEELDSFMKQLDKKLGWPTGYKIEHCNVQADKICREDLTDEEYALCVEINQNDQTLYDEAVKIWGANEK
jgi:hypothetical protein